MPVDGCPTLAWRKVLLIVTLLAVLIPVGFVLGADTDEYVTLFRDDFETQDPHWNWQHTTGTGCYTYRDGFVFLNLTDESRSEENSFACMDDYRGDELWIYQGLEVRLRCSDENELGSHLGGGIRVWGYKQGGAPPPPESLLFYSYSPKSDAALVGFWVSARADSKTSVKKQLVGIDMREWHTYTLLWEPGNATFLVDGNPVATTSNPSSKPMTMWFYSENTIVHEDSGSFNTERTDLEYKETIQIDYVRRFIRAERFQDMDSEISGLLSHALQLMEGLGQRRQDTSQLEVIYAEAQNDWREDHYFYNEAKQRLERIIGAMEHWDEIQGMFTQANECIETLTDEGDTRNEKICRAYYSNAVGTWQEYDYEATRSVLNNIMAKCPERILLPILGLILLPTLLRRR